MGFPCMLLRTKPYIKANVNLFTVHSSQNRPEKFSDFILTKAYC